MEAGALAATPKKAKEEERTIVFVDEAGFCLLPMAVRTYAPCGQTPVLRVKLTHDHLSAIGGITPDGRLVMQSQDHAYCAQDVVRFLRLRLAQASRQALGHLGWSIDPSGTGDQRVSQPRCGQTHPFRALTGLRAGTQSPGGGLESAQAARTRSNVCCRDLPHVATELRLAKERLRHRRTVLRQCFAHAGCPV